MTHAQANDSTPSPPTTFVHWPLFRHGDDAQLFTIVPIDVTQISAMAFTLAPDERPVPTGAKAVPFHCATLLPDAVVNDPPM